MRNPKIAALSDEELLKNLAQACSDSNELNEKIIRLLIDVEDRRLHLYDGSSSLFEFCVTRLKMSEGAANLRIGAARLVRRFPALGDRLGRGDIHLSTLVRLRDHLTEENLDELVDATRGKNRMQVMELLAARAPRPGAPSKLRKLPTLKTATEVAPVVERNIEAVAEMLYRLALTITRRDRDELLEVRDLMMHSNPTGDLAVVHRRAVRALRRELERERFATSARPRVHADGPSVAKTSRKVPPAVRKAVFERDGRRCTFVSADGRRCAATSLLELDHVKAHALGGAHEPENLRVRCRAHNQLHAEEVFGQRHVAAKILSSQLKSRRSAVAAESPPAP